MKLFFNFFSFGKRENKLQIVMKSRILASLKSLFESSRYFNWLSRYKDSNISIIIEKLTK